MHLQLAKKLRDDMETSWALGAAYHLLNTYHELRESKVSQSLALNKLLLLESFHE